MIYVWFYGLLHTDWILYCYSRLLDIQREANQMR